MTSKLKMTGFLYDSHLVNKPGLQSLHNNRERFLKNLKELTQQMSAQPPLSAPIVFYVSKAFLFSHLVKAQIELLDVLVIG